MGRKAIVLAAGISAGIIVSAFGIGDNGQQNRPEVSMGFFYDRLSPYGEWFQRSDYGWCWHPYHVTVYWRPYTYGRWIYTDDYGWAWDSDWDWGWAPFHYGRWFEDDNYGWSWVPGYQWGPAWVAWRRGSGIVGWSALPPAAAWEPGVGLDFGKKKIDDMPWSRWVFVSDRNFDSPVLRKRLYSAPYNMDVLADTKDITRFDIDKGRIVDRGVPVTDIDKATGVVVRRYRVSDADTQGAMYLPGEEPDTIRFFRPRVMPGVEGLTPPGPYNFDRQYQAQIAEMRERQQAEMAQAQRRHTNLLSSGGANEALRERIRNRENQMRAEHQRQMHIMENRYRRQREGFGRMQGQGREHRMETGRPEGLAGREGGIEEHGGREGGRK